MCSNVVSRVLFEREFFNRTLSATRFEIQQLTRFIYT
jgi:hypothetical protein